jgi:uncharacterized protein YndB with AHSA1/START domain
MIDIANEIESIQREVGSGQIAAGEGRSVKLRRTFDAPIDDVWDALTNPDRIGRWFLPISGDYRLGGTYQFEGNAGGKIVACDRPNSLRVTWVYGETINPEDVSEIEVRLSPAGEEATVFELEHIAIVPEDRWAQYGPGAVGVGWDMGLLGLSLHLHGGKIEDPIAWQSAPEGRDFATRSSSAWGAANVAAGADPQAADQAVANTTAFYAPPEG